MTFKLSDIAFECVKQIFEGRCTRLDVCVDPLSGGIRRMEVLCLFDLDENREGLAELLDHAPAEVLFLSAEGLALNREWVRGLLKVNGYDPDRPRVPKPAIPEPATAELKAPPRVAVTPSRAPATLNTETFGAVQRRQRTDWLVCDANAIASVLESTKDMKQQRRTMLTTFKERCRRMLPLVTARHLRALDALEVQMPNFKGVIEHIRNHLVLLKLTGAPLALPPILLLGPPGVGKTHFAKAISKSLGLHLHVRSMAETSAAFVFNGGHSAWSNSQIGAVGRLVMETPDRMAPALLVDEVDKVQRGNFSPENVLLGLLEPNTARHFRDEFLDIEIDVRPLSILLTANQALPPGSPLATRVTTMEVGLPTAEQMPAIVRAVDAQIREDEAGIARLFQPLCDEVISAIAQCAPREMRVRLVRAYALAATQANDRGGRRQRQSLRIEAGHLVTSDTSPPAPGHEGSGKSRVIPLLVQNFNWFQRIH